MTHLEKDLGEHVLKPSPDPWILRTIEQAIMQQPILWTSINDLADHIPQTQMKQILIQGIGSETKYIQERLETSKVLYDISREIINSSEFGKPGPEPWNMLDSIAKPGPTPWKMLGTVANYVPKAQMKQIVVQGTKSEIKYIEERLAISKIVYDISKEIINSSEFGKPGPQPWDIFDAIAKPGPLPWKVIGTVANYIPKAQMKQIVVQGIESEIKYMQEGLTIRKRVYDGLKEKGLSD